MEKIYHIADGKKAIGHYKLDELKEIELKDSFNVWVDGNEEWKNILDFEELKQFVITTPPPLFKKDEELSFVNSIKNWINQNSNTISNVKFASKGYILTVIAIFIYMGGISSDTCLESINNSVAERIYTTNTTELRLIIFCTSCIISILTIPISIWGFNLYKKKGF
ncbi:MAG: hypothetical protein JNL75_08510 [Chitinophagales bacterium]|nr:hypothetical protein [Chitinophagales bacterium]